MMEIPNLRDINLSQGQYIRVGSPELNRNDVFFNKSDNTYLKFYKSKEHFSNEKHALDYYKGEILVPNIISEGQMCLCLKALDGVPFVDEYLDELSYYKMGVVLKNLHANFRVPTQACSSIFNSYGCSNYYTLEQNRLKSIFGKISTDFQWRRFETILSNLLYELNEGNNLLTYLVLCHNDFCNRNVLECNGTITGIIDFEKSYYADPICDLSTIIIKEFRTQNLNAFLSSYFKSKISSSNKKKMAYFTKARGRFICLTTPRRYDIISPR